MSKLAAVMPEIDLILSNLAIWPMNTSRTTSKPAARKRRLKQQGDYNKKLRDSIRTAANKLNRKLGTYGNGDDKDASHTGPGKGKTETASANRRRPRMKQRYA